MHTLAEARTAHRVLQSVWVIVSARQNDSVSEDVAALGRKLGSALEREDVADCRDVLEEIRVWLTTSAGVVVSRLQSVFES